VTRTVLVSESAMARAYDNEAVVRRFYEELWNDWRLELAGELLAEDLRFRGSLGSVCEGREEFLHYVERVRTAFPDWTNRVEEVVTAGERVVARLTWRGTHLGELDGVAASGARVEYAGAAFFRLAGGRIGEAWVVGDTAALWEQIRSD
jgi:steroid delta-isomerase-like uncharacterized protein